MSIYSRNEAAFMKILNWYVTRGFLLAFSMAIAILTFGMTGANLI